MKLNLGDLIARINEQLASGQQASATVLFADSGGAQLFEKYGAQQARWIEARVLDVLTAKVGAYGGVVSQTVGNEIMS